MTFGPRDLGIIVSMFVIVIVVFFAMSVVVQYSNVMSSYVRNSGEIKTVGVGVNATSIDWGIIEPNQTVSRTVMVNNTSNTPITLSMFASNWIPVNASVYMSLSWNYDNSTLTIGESEIIDFMLWVHNDIHDIISFSFDITIVGSG